MTGASFNNLQTRKDAFVKLIESYNHTITDWDEGEEEDPREYLNDHRPLRRWCVVTVNYSSRGAHNCFLPTFGEYNTAKLRATEFADDDLYEELPVAVVDLDTGKKFRWSWTQLKWVAC